MLIMNQRIFIISIVSLIIVISSGQSVMGYGGPPEQSSANNYTVDIISDNASYTLGESVIFSGSVNKYDEDRNLRITIFGAGNSLIISQKTSVNEDGTFLHEVNLNEKFSDGKFKVKAQYGNSKATITIISFEVISNNVVSQDNKIPDWIKNNAGQDNKIPDWIKNNAGWWADGQIDDNSFVEGIQFLIKEGFMKLSK